MESGTESLAPREHGAYAMLSYPVLSGLLVGGGSLAGAGFAVMAVAAFMAHEPLVVLLGQRGPRLEGKLGGRARRWMVAWCGVAILGAAAVLRTSSGEQLLPALLPATAASGVLALTLLGRARTLGAELIVACAFAGLHAPIAAAGGAGVEAVVGPSVVWAAGFVLTTMVVHSLKHRFKGAGPNGWTVTGTRVLTVLGVLVSVAAVRPETALPGWAPAFLPMGVVVLALSFVAVHPRYLVRVGWTLAASQAVSLVALLLLVSR